MKFQGGTLTADDLPRLEANYKRLQKIIRELKKEAGPKSTAEQFWDSYSKAVKAISAQQYNCPPMIETVPASAWYTTPTYGDRWKVLAKSDETVLARLPTRMCKYKGERGGEIRYMRDQRLPAAQYWPGGQLPNVGMEFAAPAPAPATWEGQHPMLASLNAFLESEREARDNFREMQEIHSDMDSAFAARKTHQQRISDGIDNYSDSLEYWDPDVAHEREIEAANQPLDYLARKREQHVEMARRMINVASRDMEYREAA